MKPSESNSYYIEIKPDDQTPALYKGDVLVMGGSDIKKLWPIQDETETCKN